MASNRLTNTMRKDIVQIVVNKTFEERNKEISKLRSEIYHKLVDSVIPDGFNYVLNLGDVKKEWFTEVSNIEVSITMNDNVPSCDSGYVDFGGDCRYVPACLAKRYNNEINVQFKNLSVHAQALVIGFMRKSEEIHKGKIALKSKVTEVVHSATTFKKLKEIWPEVEVYYKLDDYTSNLPACVNPAELNTLIARYKKAA